MFWLIIAATVTKLYTSVATLKKSSVEIMLENLDLILQIIRVDFFIAFGLYTFAYLIISSFLKNEKLDVVDETSNKIIAFAGIIFLLIWIALTLKSYFESSELEKSGMIQRMFGNYWFGYWLQPILLVSLSQLLRFKRVRKQKVLRIVISILFIVSIEQYIIILTSFERDYLPSSWSFHFTITELIFGILSKIIVFLIIVVLYYFLEKKIKIVLKKT